MLYTMVNSIFDIWEKITNYSLMGLMIKYIVGVYVRKTLILLKLTENFQGYTIVKIIFFLFRKKINQLSYGCDESKLYIRNLTETA